MVGKVLPGAYRTLLAAGAGGLLATEAQARGIETFQESLYLTYPTANETLLNAAQHTIQSPGFEGIFAIAGIIAAYCWASTLLEYMKRPPSAYSLGTFDE